MATQNDSWMYLPQSNRVQILETHGVNTTCKLYTIESIPNDRYKLIAETLLKVVGDSFSFTAPNDLIHVVITKVS